MVAQIPTASVHTSHARTADAPPAAHSNIFGSAQGVLLSALVKVRGRIQRPAKGFDIERADVRQQRLREVDEERRTRQSLAVISTSAAGMYISTF